MNANLWKDLVSIRLTMLFMIAFAIIFCCGFGQGSSLCFIIGPALAVTAVGTSIRLDEKGNWDKFAISSGESRVSIIRSKMVLGLIGAAGGLAAGVVSVAVFVVIDDISYEIIDLLALSLLGFAFGMAVCSAMIYCCYRFGSNYAGLFSAVIVGCTAGSVIFLTDILDDVLDDALWIFPSISAILLVLAAFVFSMSARYYLHKDF